MTAPLLTVQDLTCGYKSRPVLENLTFQASPGTCLAVVGPNGSGKSTLLKVLSGFLHPQAGRFLMGGREITSLTALQRGRLLTYLPQQGGAEFGFTVREMVTMGTFARDPHFFEGSNTTRAVTEVMEELQIASLEKRPFPLLSGGEKRLVLTARALVQEPEILLLDEPTSALDLNRVGLVMSAIQRRTRRGALALCVLHDLNVALSFCDQFLLLGSQTGHLCSSPGELLDPGRLEQAYAVAFHREDHGPSGGPMVVPIYASLPERP